MLFGLINALASFQVYINKAIAGLINVFCIIYLNDILIYTLFTDFIIYWETIRKMLAHFKEFKLYINLKKCDFLVSEVKFLKFIIKRNGVAMDLQRIKTI